MATADIARVARESIFAVGLSATWPGRHALFDHPLLRVLLGRDTRVRLRIDPGGVYLTSDPPLLVRVLGPLLPDFFVTTVRWDFDEGRFEAHTEGPVARKVYELVAEKWLDAELKERLPPALTRAGYDPREDPDLQSTLGEASALLVMDGDAKAPEAKGELSPDLSRARDATAFLQVAVSEDLAIPVPDLDELEVFLRKGTILDLTAETRGAVSDPALDRVVVRGHDRGVVIRSTGEGLLASLEALEVDQLTIRPGPKLDFEYELLVERLLGAPGHIANLFAVLRGHTTAPPPSQVRIEMLREDVDALLQDAVGGLFRDLLREYDAVIPGVSLASLFEG